MLLFVTGPRAADEAAARAIYDSIAISWPAMASLRAHPRTGAPFAAAVTRFDLFLAAFSPSSAPSECGLRVRVPPPDQWWRFAPDLRRPLRELIRTTFPPGPRYAAPYDPVGPSTSHPSPETTARLRTLIDRYRGSSDPAQRPVDPRLWLVLSPPLPAELEVVFLSTFLRAEPFARVARVPEEPHALEAWLDGEVDRLARGEGLATDGLVVDLDRSPMPAMIARDGSGAVLASSQCFDLVSGLEDLYATREELGPGEVYNRLHSLGPRSST